MGNPSPSKAIQDDIELLLPNPPFDQKRRNPGPPFSRKQQASDEDPPLVTSDLPRSLEVKGESENLEAVGQRSSRRVVQKGAGKTSTKDLRPPVLDPNAANEDTMHNTRRQSLRNRRPVSYEEDYRRLPVRRCKNKIRYSEYAASTEDEDDEELQDSFDQSPEATPGRVLKKVRRLSAHSTTPDDEATTADSDDPE